MKEANEYLKNHPYINGDYPTHEEQDDFNYLNKKKEVLLNSGYPELIEWYLRMNDSLVIQRGECKTCKAPVSYSKYH